MNQGYYVAEETGREACPTYSMKRAVVDQLGMPRCPVERAIAVLERLTGKPFFGACPRDAVRQ